MTSQSPGVVVRAADNPHPHPRTDNGEQAFADFLDSLPCSYEWESVTFHGLPPATRGGALRAFTPDVKLVSVLGQSLIEPIYLELTEADRYILPSDLPAAVLEKNTRYSASRKGFISPAQYLEKKSLKIRHAVRIHEIRVVLLTYALQLECFENPDILLALIDEAAQADAKHLRLVG